MSRAGRKTRRKRSPTAVRASATFVDVFRRRITNPDNRSHAEFLAEMRARQAAGQLVNPATAALLDRLERAIH